jgi:hydroxypyruvate isomerase
MAKLTRRDLLKSSAIGLAVSQVTIQGSATSESARKGRIRQSVCQWCYRGMTIDQLAQAAANIGLQGVDLLQPDDYEIPRRYGLLCSMGYAGGGEIKSALNRVENHAAIEQAFRTNIPRAAKAGVPNVITFSGNRAGLPDEEGARNTIAGLNRVKKIAEDHGVTVCLELLNSKRDHHDYMCDHTAWGVRVAQEVNSPNVKLLYDIYHMQIMEGDLIETIRQNIQWIGHFHTGGVPGRHELDNTQEIQWESVMRAIADSGFRGYVAHEFIPTREPMASLKAAADLCDV